MCHLGNISTRLGRTLAWDAAKEQDRWGCGGESVADEALSGALEAGIDLQLFSLPMR